MSRVESYRGGRRPAVGLAAVALVAALGVGACQNGSTPAAAAPKAAATTTTTAQPAAAATVRVTPEDGSRSARPDRPVTVTADGGVLSSVTLTDSKGRAVDGAYTQGHAGWTSTGRLAVRSTYTVRAVATNADGQATRTT